VTVRWVKDHAERIAVKNRRRPPSAETFTRMLPMEIGTATG